MYAHDAVAVAIAAARAAAAENAPAGALPASIGERPAIARALARMAFEGATGTVGFDRNRSRLQVPDLRPFPAIGGGSDAGAR
jgi:ABC-type branched-subunit amino acid transport system substrate-binding protein